MAVFVQTTTAISPFMFDTDFSNAKTAALFTTCADQADEHIKAKLSRRYDISAAYFNTTTSAPPMLQKIGNWLTVGFMYEQLGRGSKDQFAQADRFIKRANDILDDLADKTLNLLDSTGAIIPASTTSLAGVLSASDNYTPTFGEDDTLSWEVDPDKLEDISNSRT